MMYNPQINTFSVNIIKQVFCDFDFVTLSLEESIHFDKSFKRQLVYSTINILDLFLCNYPLNFGEFIHRTAVPNQALNFYFEA